MYSDFDRELGEARVETERQAQIDAARQALRREGTQECQDCGCTISIARRRVYPSAIRCLECQEQFEKDMSAR